MSLLVCAALAVSHQPLPEPLLWLNSNGKITIEGREVRPKFSDGTQRVKTANGWGYDFDGKRAGILFGDSPSLKFNDEITVALWLNLRSYVNDGPGAQVLFRGDDRCGLDPYSIAIHGDGTINFAVQNESDQGRHVTAEIPLNRWVHVVANYDGQTGRLQMFLDGNLLAFATTSVRPYLNLDHGWVPGVSVGNVQNNAGPHNQPINGTVQDLRLYRGVFNPDDLGLFPSAPSIPPRAVFGSGQ